VEPESNNPLERHRAGKRTLVFGVHKSAVRFSEEEDNTCPNYWHFSPTGFCPYDCTYCYLAGTRSVYLSPSVKLFVNLPEILREIDAQAMRLAEPTAFYLGKLQDALALDPLTGYSRIMIPFFAKHQHARMTLLSKCADVENLLDLKHNNHIYLSWSLNPPEIYDAFEQNVPHPSERIKAMQRCAKAGYPVRAVLMPMIPVDDWQGFYGNFVKNLLDAVPLARLTMGGICSYNDAKRLMDAKLGRDNTVTNALDTSSTGQADHRARFSPETRIEMYRVVIDLARKIRPDLELALCLEEPDVMEAVGLAGSKGRCNCVL
jgi:spore photoproduct lyase